MGTKYSAMVLMAAAIAFAATHLWLGSAQRLPADLVRYELERKH